jgi:hypothetical protein
MQDWVDLYLELSNKIMNSPDVEARWADLWHNQVSFLDTEVEFPSPAAFFSFRILETSDAGEGVQKLLLQVDVRYFFETMSESYHGSVNQASAVAFLKSFNGIHKCFHASEGANYSSMRRIMLNPEEAGGAGNLYLQSFTCVVMDYSAKKQYAETNVSGVEVENGKGPQSEPVDNGFDLN